jgi:hypothetical protein
MLNVGRDLVVAEIGATEPDTEAGRRWLKREVDLVA